MTPHVLRRLTVWIFCAIAIWLSSVSAWALEPIDVAVETTAIDLSRSTEAFEGTGDGISVKTAPDSNGVINRIEVRSTSETSSGNWLAFALANNSDEQIDRLIVAPHFSSNFVND